MKASARWCRSSCTHSPLGRSFTRRRSATGSPAALWTRHRTRHETPGRRERPEASDASNVGNEMLTPIKEFIGPDRLRSRTMFPSVTCNKLFQSDGISAASGCGSGVSRQELGRTSNQRLTVPAGELRRRRVACSAGPTASSAAPRTPDGPELRSWATSAWVRASWFRDELFLKLFSAAALGSDALSATAASPGWSSSSTQPSATPDSSRTRALNGTHVRCPARAPAHIFGAGFRSLPHVGTLLSVLGELPEIHCAVGDPATDPRPLEALRRLPRIGRTSSESSSTSVSASLPARRAARPLEPSVRERGAACSPRRSVTRFPP